MITHTVVNPSTNTTMTAVLNAQQTALLAQRSNTQASMGCSPYTGMPPFVAVIILVFCVISLASTLFYYFRAKVKEEADFFIAVVRGITNGLYFLLLWAFLAVVVVAINTLFFM